MTKQIFEVEKFHNKFRTQMKKFVDLQIGTDAVNMFLDYLFGDIEDKIIYAEKQAKGNGHKTIRAEDVDAIYSLRWQTHQEKNGLLFPLEIWMQMKEKEQIAMKKTMKRIGVRLVFD